LKHAARANGIAIHAVSSSTVAARPVYSLEDFLELLEYGDEYPYYSVLLYTPENGLDQRLHEYVVKRWDFLNRLTGDGSLLAAQASRNVA
jgi:hypothetical protein